MSQCLIPRLPRKLRLPVIRAEAGEVIIEILIGSLQANPNQPMGILLLLSPQGYVEDTEGARINTRGLSSLDGPSSLMSKTLPMPSLQTVSRLKQARILNTVPITTMDSGKIYLHISPIKVT